MTQISADRPADYPDADLPPDHDEPVTTTGQKLALGLGSAALLLAMATDAIAVAGRHLGVALLGSIEIVQACIVVAASSALIAATMLGAHARVHILLEKAKPATVRMLDAFADTISALLFLWLAAGSLWLASDLWNGTEITEILQIPLRWLRAVWITSALLIAGLFAWRAVRGHAVPHRPGKAPSR